MSNTSPKRGVRSLLDNCLIVFAGFHPRGTGKVTPSDVRKAPKRRQIAALRGRCVSQSFGYLRCDVFRPMQTDAFWRNLLHFEVLDGLLGVLAVRVSNSC